MSTEVSLFMNVTICSQPQSSASSGKSISSSFSSVTNERMQGAHPLLDRSASHWPNDVQTSGVVVYRSGRGGASPPRPSRRGASSVPRQSRRRRRRSAGARSRLGCASADSNAFVTHVGASASRRATRRGRRLYLARGDICASLWPFDSCVTPASSRDAVVEAFDRVDVRRRQVRRKLAQEPTRASRSPVAADISRAAGVAARQSVRDL